MSRILLLLPTRTWRAEAFLAAARRLGLEITVATDKPLVWTGRVPEGVIVLDFACAERAAEQAAEFAREHPIAAVVGADDDTVVLAGAIAKALGLPHDPIAALEAARDKRVQRERLLAAGLPVPRFTRFRLDEDPAAVAARVGLPCVIKPLRLAASRGVMRADDVTSLGAAMRRLGALLASPDVDASGECRHEALAETFLPGAEVALEGLLEDGALRVLALFDKPDPLDGPYFEETIYVTPSRVAPETQARIAKIVTRAAAALGLTRGPIHAELRVNVWGPWILELAARPIGGLCSRALRFEGGVTLEELVLRGALGLNTAGTTREADASGVMMVPIPGAGVVERVEGVADAGRVPGIEQVVITAHAGERLVPFPEGSRYPGFIFARGEDPAAVEAALRAAHGRLRFVLAPEADAATSGAR
ncbi:MAG: ATP-grasp domain-containing protein [Candidatus Eisenbacteria bacterium]|nr:ATP-grasp domain-containing protein [Candidatus Eisenbacteria bacterium]